MQTKKKTNGILAGILLVIIGICLLWYNEGRTIKTSQAIGEAREQYVEVNSDKVDKKHEGKLIATNGNLTVSENGIRDDLFNIQVSSAKLVRTVEMYQWEEDCETDDDGYKQCTYTEVWSDDLIDSTFFEDTSHTNPTTMPYDNKSFFDEEAKVGAYQLNDTLLNKLSASQYITNLDSVKAQELGLEISDGRYYTNVKNDNPEIGNIRISFRYNDSKTVSILAIQKDGGFQEFVSSSGYKIYELQEGIRSGEDILQVLTTQNNVTKWILRLLGTLLVTIGFAAMISPLQRLANFIPILGTLFGWVSGIITVVLGLTVSLVVIAIAWLRYRPILSIALLVGVICLLVLVIKLKRKIPRQNQKFQDMNSSQNTAMPEQTQINQMYQQNAGIPEQTQINQGYQQNAGIPEQTSIVQGCPQNNSIK